VLIGRRFSRHTRLAAIGSTVALLAAGGGAAAALSGLHGRAAANGPRVPLTTTTTTVQTGIPPTTTNTPPSQPGATGARLVSYGGCSQFLAAVKAEAMREVGPYGLQGSGFGGAGPAIYNGTTRAAMPAASGATASAGASAGASYSANAPAESAAPQSTASYSATNNQENGVDEPDLTKTDGHLLLILRHSPLGLQVADVSSSPPHLDGFVPLPQIGSMPQLFMTGGYAVVIGSAQWRPSTAAPGAGAPTTGTDAPASYVQATDVVVISLADPAHPSVVRAFDLQGTQVGARLIAGRIIVVLQGEPNLPFVTPSDGSASSQAAATKENQSIVAGTGVSDWLPSVTVSPGGMTRTAACATALHPTVDSGLGTVSVLSVDPSKDQPGSEVTVVGNASTVYASTSSLFVATTPWAQQMGMGVAGQAVIPQPDNLTTDIHGFDLSNPAAPRYIGSGLVPGTLIGQYALSEYDGYLRVATTVGLATPPPNEGSTPVQLSDSRVTVLAPAGQALVPVGSVSGLGQGEKIYGVRFVGPLGYVVTFRQTDPLYVIDLSKPTHPVLQGQLGLTGYSAFLQPLGGSLLLGVGEAVDANYRRSGLQLSVFDVSNPVAPALRSKIVLDNASSVAENDPHALLWWPAQRLVIMPVSDYSSQFNGVIVWHLSTNGTLQEVARITPPTVQPKEYPCPNCAQSSGPAGSTAIYSPIGLQVVERTVVVGDVLYTVTDGGLMATSMNSWNQVGWLPYSGS
jgi:uncharacterized secreted protein with C-terminal beta-propeller domain